MAIGLALVAVAFTGGAFGQRVLAQTGGSEYSTQALTAAVGGPISYVRINRQDTAATTSSTSYVNLTSVPIAVPANATVLLMARFSAESACYNSPASANSNWCSVRIIINTPAGAITELYPQAGTDFAFDSSDSGKEGSASWESHSMDRSIRLPAQPQGMTYTVTVQWAIVGTGAIFRLDDWSFTVERAA